ncbi:CubicO group peptidase (beta-lactamase class C family) [Anseongella ginsenosidimutans]|uniref:CubicO group peptidase (Beta-lactamase class C family) n=1 Tax=Anseongella ginsenosidimutans TaxID=496056 RepID=A0A4V2UU37_9SPHI|nr:serine hydrolase domain-containing protein [Anseongella ginsenosidimutans]QEC51639.1 beta-lactamase family protein [Anseongella ginsenosidimutans]TCS88973.1 CubicO group peptidase (beta-lactamase class C family) [Anseongella ginsenosidimutans]
MTPAEEPGFAMLAFQSGRNMQPECTGLANLELKAPITPLSNFRMASVSKQFTAMSVLMLSERKELQLEDPLKRFFSPFAANYRDITIRQLLTHTSGIRDYEALIPPARRTQLLDEDVLELVNAHKGLYFKPGQQFRYSNTGYCLLALLAEKVSGKSFPALMKSLIFDPLAMSTSLVYEPGCTIPQRALGYVPAGDSSEGGFILNDQSLTSATKGDGGVYTSLVDYLKWHEALFTEKLVSAGLLNAAFSSQAPVNNSVGYGYGWFSGREKDGSQALFHSGETSGFLNIVYRNPSKKLLIAIFSNRNDGSISQKFEATARRLNLAVRLEGFTAENRPPLFNWLSEQYN